MRHKSTSRPRKGSSNHLFLGRYPKNYQKYPSIYALEAVNDQKKGRIDGFEAIKYGKKEPKYGLELPLCGLDPLL
ncbi:hypothetical protein [Aquimarina algicola]|uniref:Uncharacterized protein n=1 Tax=Aquimarina algicola TaxID=2589995 RepID=A0A504J0Q9_9FLAO|nr:hypothetical protein [Aquimarina algicola]TPN84397.1 hypothetical protein FHK87_15790 [Aquimarina algicola]